MNGRGSLVITTEPAGANIAIANLAPRTSPATISDLRLGKYTLAITLAGYDPVSLDLDVKENAATDPGVIRLVRQVGGVEISSDPAGLKYEIRPAASRFFSTGAGNRQGTTPATVKDLPTGDYIVVLTREGWPNHEQPVTIGRGDIARVSWKTAGGTVEIVTVPAGATVIARRHEPRRDAADPPRRLPGRCDASRSSCRTTPHRASRDGRARAAAPSRG